MLAGALTPFGAIAIFGDGLMDQALRAPGVGRQDRGSEVDALGIVGCGLTVAHAWLANGDRPDAGHDLALG